MRMGSTPLHYAASKGVLIVLAILIDEYNVSAWSRDLQGRTPLHFAAEYGHKEACEILRKAMQKETGVLPIGPCAPTDLVGNTPLGE